MRWISVDEDLPPPGTKVTIWGTYGNSYSDSQTWILEEGTFDPQIGWSRNFMNRVYYWGECITEPSLEKKVTMELKAEKAAKKEAKNKIKKFGFNMIKKTD